MMLLPTRPSPHWLSQKVKPQAGDTYRMIYTVLVFDLPRSKLGHFKRHFSFSSLLTPGCREVVKQPILDCFDKELRATQLNQELFLLLVLLRYPFYLVKNLLRSWYVRHMVVLLNIHSKVASNDKPRQEFQQTHSAKTTAATKASLRQIGKAWKG